MTTMNKLWTVLAGLWAFVAVLGGLVLYDLAQGDTSDPLELNMVLYPDQSEDRIPGDVRFTGNGPTEQGSHYRMRPITESLHDCTTVKGMKRGWLEYCG